MGRRDIPLLVTEEEAMDMFDVSAEQVRELTPVGTLFNPKEPGVALYNTREIQEIERRSKKS